MKVSSKEWETTMGIIYIGVQSTEIYKIILKPIYK